MNWAWSILSGGELLQSFPGVSRYSSKGFVAGGQEGNHRDSLEPLMSIRTGDCRVSPSSLPGLDLASLGPL